MSQGEYSSHAEEGIKKISINMSITSIASPRFNGIPRFRQIHGSLASSHRLHYETLDVMIERRGGGDWKEGE